MSTSIAVRVVSTLLVLTAFVACAPPQDAREQLYALFDEDWAARLTESPQFATSVGDHSRNDELADMTLPAIERRVERRRDLLRRFEAIDVSGLSAADRISARMFERQLRSSVQGFEFGGYEMPLNADSGFHMGFARMYRPMPFQTVDHYDDYIARMRAIPAYFEQQQGHMRAGIERGFTLPRVTLEGYEDTISAHIVDDPQDSAFWVPFEEVPASLGEMDRERILTDAEAAITDAVVPAYQGFYDFFVGEYLPGARETVGASDLPGGQAYYGEQVRWFTTLDVTPQEVHEIGLSEVARIRAEMEEVIRETGFEGSYAEFLDFLRTDPRFYPKTAQELLERAAWIAKTMDGKLPSLFATLPRVPYTVEPVPDHMAPKYTAGRYVSAPYNSTQPGIYWVNTYNLPSRPLYALAALTLHEAVPGHHLQNAIAAEIDAGPEFRRHDYLSAFGEGWGLYAEYLGLEAGIYEDPYGNFGRLTYEIWRACRLVVDTGVHAFGWTRQQMLDYLAENTALSLHEVTTETDRYISWPGQALAYKMGELKIRELRGRAEEALGSDFDVRHFHDAVLANGSVPLDILEELIDAWIEEQRQ
ncbi:MAG: DUF885 domain-containing protein [Holophagales bacterium]|nr:DUF885 domain-containing protein [Holophagales bacterium]MYF04377.1 DUF885 domain-containing protein [Holophagales bacterium]MYJ25676.1 DUF885 domain-containing protein [Holophagales bacterium]